MQELGSQGSSFSLQLWPVGLMGFRVYGLGGVKGFRVLEY